MRVNILDIHIDNLSKSDVLQKVRNFLNDGRQHKIFTPNPEMLVLASRDEEFRKILNSADILVPDGFGLILVSVLLGMPFKSRVTGVELVEDISKLVAEHGASIFLLGGAKDVAAQAAEKLRSKISSPSTVEGRNLVVYSLDGLHVNEHSADKAIHEINHTKPDILFVALGQGRQERFIHKYLPELPSVKIAIGVGGALDFISGRIHRAPLLLRRLGLEWLWRLALQPWRLFRIINAVIIFPIKVFYRKRKILP